MKLIFDTVDELRAFVKDELKGRRGGKAGDGDETGAQAGATGQAPAPAMPQGGPGFPGAGAFAPPAGGATAAVGFPAAGASVGPAPEVTALIQRIGVRIDGAVASGQPVEAARSWLATQCGPECAGYTLDQLKTIAMPKLSFPVLENIAKLMAA